ncbi:tripartite motif-containing protein 16 isoform X2 [Myxocyprinus asiaticus]|uniref:tripartite motif-containing protein 16 isoform X2 n=1 Tax=Myxocyprinus asiaticus TaxID=70543 RepID=UPI002223BA3E|nr:tripartite motif-containing protein 16 isoform X2 [Myxocyprinus asiaticus]
MADTNISVDKDQFCCSVCLEVLWEPVTIPCGHSYCMECIKGYWRKCELKEEYSCPQCRRTFSPRPALSRNTMLADIVEKLRRTGVQDVLQSHIKDVDCDVCTGRKHRAVKFCVKCQTLYCEIHLKPHNERNRGRMHQLIEVTKQSQKRICSRHNKLRGVYCRTDQQCICSSCLKDGHKGHSVVSIMEERTDKQKHLEEVWRKSKQRCKEREKELRDIVKYIKNYKNLCAPPEVGGQPSIDVHPYFSLLILRKALTELKERVTDICDRESARISEMVDEEHNQSSENISSLPVNSETARGISPQTEPMTRGDFLQYCRDLTLDPNTANSFIRLSGDHREVTTELEPQSYSDHPERFSSWAQVLCTEGLSGRCYWEVEWGGSGGVSIGVSYKGIPRTGGNTDRKLGCNSKSWSLDFSDSLCLFRHDKSRIEIHTPMPNRIGVYLDHRAGTLAFYSVSLADDSMTLLHQEQTTFAQPLYPGFWVGLGSTLKLCQTFSFSA